MELEERMDNLIVQMEEIGQLVERRIKDNERYEKPITEKKNSHLHLLLETSLMNKVERQAKEQKISIAEFVRRRLRRNEQLDRIESKIDILSSYMNS
ncbi:MAG: hypothetical protein PVJ67_04930 [Candidatus Pacearchaeota archaeon]|jgi:hypothetical protein